MIVSQGEFKVEISDKVLASDILEKHGVSAKNETAVPDIQKIIKEFKEWGVSYKWI